MSYQTKKLPVRRVKDVSIYLLQGCNLKCSYCDRETLDGLWGNPHMQSSDEDGIVKFVLDTDFKMLSFHGGETLLAIKRIDRILERVYEHCPMVFIQTNGTLILKNKWFFDKWKEKLYVSISYDFTYQAQNRKWFDIDATLEYLNSIGINPQLQPIIPLYDPNCFSLDQLQAIVSMYKKHNISCVTLLPLQYSRNHGWYRIYIEEIDLPDVYLGLMQFIQALYVYGINITIMGYSEDYDRRYFKFTKQVVLAPDGYLYPDYGFLENQLPQARIGAWREDIIFTVDPEKADDNRHPDCKDCGQKEKCSLTYIYNFNRLVHKTGSQKPNFSKCYTYSKIIENCIKHLDVLKSKTTLVHHVGMDNESLYLDRPDTADDRL